MTESAAAPTPEVKPADAPAATPTPTPTPEVAAEDPANIWAEMEAAERGVPIVTPAQEKLDKQVKDDAFAGDPENAIDPSVSPPAAPASAQSPDPVGNGTPATAPDPWASAPPELKAQYDAQVRALANATTEQSRKSIEGRIASWSRRLEERKAAAAAPPPSTEPEPDPLATVKSDYPEIAEPFEKALAPLKEKVSKAEAKEKAALDAADAQMDRDLAENERLFEEKHPGVWDLLKANGKKFGEWIVDQPLELRRAVAVNKDAIVDLDGAVKTFDRFKEHLGLASPPTPTPVPTPTPTPAPAPTNELSLKRAAQLAGSETPKIAGGRPTVSGIPESGDPQAIWNAMAAEDPDEKKYRQRA